MKVRVGVAVALLFVCAGSYAEPKEEGTTLLSESDAQALCASYAKEDRIPASEMESYMKDCLDSVEAQDEMPSEGEPARD